MIRFAQISDLHFAHASWNPQQFLSKQWLGNFNLLFFRQRQFLSERLDDLIPLLKEKGIHRLVVCGDISSTSRHQEFEMGKKFIEKTGIQTFAVPGNHDHYTRKAYREKWFYNYFPSQYEGEFNLRDHGVAAQKLATGWWMVLLDTALATSLVSSEGLFSIVAEAHLERLLRQIPENDRIILVTHYPLFSPDHDRKKLQRASALQTLLRRHPNVKLYLHGHTHRHCIADLRPDGLPILLDSGTASSKKRATCNLIEITDQKCVIDVYSFDECWKKERSTSLQW
ncbi:MAG: metallophosphoesterase [Verrucomicrobia bacterium]|nr:metallophosphoesterase [Verrucomicrobiota bacterium]